MSKTIDNNDNSFAEMHEQFNFKPAGAMKPLALAAVERWEEIEYEMDMMADWRSCGADDEDYPDLDPGTVGYHTDSL